MTNDLKQTNDALNTIISRTADFDHGDQNLVSFVHGLYKLAQDGRAALEAALSVSSSGEAVPFFYGIREPNGQPFLDETCVWSSLDDAKDAAADLGNGYEAVPLYAHPSPSSVQTGVAVKALEWEQPDGPHPEGCWLGHGTDFCQYYIRFQSGSWWHPADSEDAEPFDTIDGAKAACQADYERRILTALSSVPASPDPAVAEMLDELTAAGKKVLEGLNARIDRAVENVEPVPVFSGIVDLHDAVNRSLALSNSSGEAK